MTTGIDHHRHSIRLREYDYSQAGAYFVTICTLNRDCLFGESINEGILLNKFGDIAHDEWLKTAAIRKEIDLDEFVVMPNHVHGIIVITDNVGATRWVARHDDDPGDGGDGNRATHRVAPTGPGTGTIGAIMGQYKSIVTKRINMIRINPGGPVWQRGYFERVIRDHRELAAIREYIANNPAKWLLDKDNPAHAT
jgi:REP element-mobilizing transposase RayT